EGCTVLLSSHEIGEVETLADRLYWLDRGRLRLDETAESLRARFRRIEIQQPAMATPPAVPEHAWQVERAGSAARYVDAHFEPHAVPPGATVTPMTLREIFVVLLRQRGEVTPMPAPVA